MVGCHFAGDLQPFRLGLPHQVHGFFRADVTDVIPAAGLPDQFDVPLHLSVFTGGGNPLPALAFRIRPFVNVSAVFQAVVLGMGHDQGLDKPGLSHGLTHDFIRLDPDAVIAEGHGSRLLQASHIHDGLSLFVPGDGGVGFGPHHRIPADQGAVFVHSLYIVRYRIQVRHGHYCSKAAGCRRFRTGTDGFLILKPRLPQVHMGVDEARHDDFFPAVDFRVIEPGVDLLVSFRHDDRDPASADQHVHNGGFISPGDRPGVSQYNHVPAPLSGSSVVNVFDAIISNIFPKIK